MIISVGTRMSTGRGKLRVKTKKITIFYGDGSRRETEITTGQPVVGQTDCTGLPIANSAVRAMAATTDVVIALKSRTRRRGQTKKSGSPLTGTRVHYD